MTPFAESLAVATITLLAAISPGPDFAMVTRNSYRSGRRSGLLSAAGIALGVQVHVLYTMFGVGLLMQHAGGLLAVVKGLGAAYLVWIGIQTLRKRATLPADQGAAPALPPLKALRTGFLTNALNPKTTLFVVSTYTQVIDRHTPLLAQFGYGLFMSAVHFAWFALIACLVCTPSLRAAMLRRQCAVNRTIGVALCGLGMALGFSHVA